MEEKKGPPTEAASILKKIEDQIKETLEKKKREIEKELDENIRKEKERAREKMDQIESDLTEEKEMLASYRNMLAEMENSKTELKMQIKEHLDKAIHFQAEIETLTGKTLDELKQVGGLSQKLEELQQDVGDKVSSLKKDLEQKFGIVTQVPESIRKEEEEIDLDKELSKLKKIKELLKTDQEEESTLIAQIIQGASPEVLLEEPAEEREPDKTGALPEEILSRTLQEDLEEYRRTASEEEESRLSYFEKNGMIIIDGESLISVLSQCLKDVRGFCAKLDDADSPKNQFFIKQDIIKCQETVRKVILHCLRLCEKGNYFLPGYTSDVLNEEILKNILEKVSMENWSNKNDFSFFKDYAEDLMEAFHRRIVSPDIYFQAVMEELNQK